MSKQKIAIYGLSTETEKAIPKLEQNNKIVGLLDGFKTDGELFGYKIISFDQIVQECVEKIIVVARPGSCKAIAKRIGERCKEENIELVDIRGKDLLKENKIVYDFKNVNGYTRAELLKAVDEVEVVSFDLFDTLVVRDVSSNTDIVDILSLQLYKNDKESTNHFVNKRISSEKKLSTNGRAPKLKEIYLDFCQDEKISEEYAEKEFLVDLKAINPRKDMVVLLNEVKEKGKQVYITSDTYYTEEQIKQILEKCGIIKYDGLILSCENKISKSGNLFDVLKSRANTAYILHIGDDIVSDIEKAKEHGIGTFEIFSSAELLDLVGGLGLENLAVTLSDRIKIGMFASRLFSSPFQFEAQGRKLHMDSAEDIGYLICAPMIFDFVKWFEQKVSKERYSDIWFSARDGYLIKKLFDLEDNQKESKYFLTSRISAIRSGVENINDIRYVNEMKFSGTLHDNLMCRFGLDDTVISDLDKDNREEGLSIYAKSILETAKLKKENNLKYINNLNPGHKDIAFFDFVAKGTSQMYVQKLVQNHISGLYFLQLELDYMRNKNLEIESFYSEDERLESAIFDNYYILETILTAPAPSLDEFDAEGKPIYAKETRSEKDINCFMKVQEGIINYAKKYLDICPQLEFVINKKLDEVFLKLIHNIEIRDTGFLNLTVEDPFFNRMTNITDVI